LRNSPYYEINEVILVPNNLNSASIDVGKINKATFCDLAKEVFSKKKLQSNASEIGEVEVRSHQGPESGHLDVGARRERLVEAIKQNPTLKVYRRNGLIQDVQEIPVEDFLTRDAVGAKFDLWSYYGHASLSDR
jgi:hypothetical protein